MQTPIYNENPLFNSPSPKMQLILATLLVYVATSAGCQASSFDKSTKPQIHVDIGPYLSIDVRYNETRSDNKLRLSKFNMKHVMSVGSQEKIPILEIKSTVVEELINCNNLTLLNDDILIDCKPAQAHLAKEVKVTTGTDKSATDTYVKRNSIYQRGGVKVSKSIKLKHELALYPLQEDSIHESIKNASAELNLGELEPEKPTYKIGYYFEYIMGKDSPLMFECHGEVFLSINKSCIQVFRRKDSVQWLESILYHAEDSGYLLSFQNVICKKPGLDLFGLKTDFIVAQRKEFPYLAVKHTTVAYPLELVLNYEATVQQVRNNENANAYNTSISITSRSAISDLFNFDLSQEFVNLETNSGSENMKLYHPQLALLVDSIWNEDDFVKNLNVYIIKNFDWLDKSLMLLNNVMHFQYADLEDNQHVIMTLKVLRALLPSIDDIFPSANVEENSQDENQILDDVDPQNNHDEL